jgi:hypothetical protein
MITKIKKQKNFSHNVGKILKKNKNVKNGNKNRNKNKKKQKNKNFSHNVRKILKKNIFCNCYLYGLLYICNFNFFLL